MKAEQCLTDIKQKDNILELSTWLAIDDTEQEGVWTHLYTRKDVSPLPWAENRPYKDGESHNCARLKLTIGTNSDTFGDIKSE